MEDVLERISYQTADMRNLPFEAGSFDRVRAMGLAGNYSDDKNLAEAQWVLRNGYAVRVSGGIDTVSEDIMG